MVVKGKKLTLKEYLAKVKSEFQGMTPRQKLEHFWEYYKGILIALAIIIAGTAIMVSAANSLNMELKLAGALVNVDANADGFLLLQDGYAEHAGLQQDKEQVTVHSMQFKDPFTTLDQTYALNVHESIVALANDKTLDYILFDDVALPFFLDPDLLMDLRQFFSQQALDAMGAAVIKLQMPQTGEEIPVAVDIRDTAFYHQYVVGDKPIYLGFVVSSPRIDTCKDLWQFLKGGSTELLQTRLAGTVVDAALTEEGFDRLTDGFFAAQGYAEGDDRVELTRQSLIQPEGETENVAAMVEKNVRNMLQQGALDYLVADEAAMQTLSDAELLDLRQIMTEAEIAELAEAVRYRDGVPVAVEMSATAFGRYCTGKAILCFNANTKRLEQCKALWAFMDK